MTEQAGKASFIKGILIGLLGLLFWWGLSIESPVPESATTGVHISFFGWGPAMLDRDFFHDLAGEGALAGWTLGCVLALACAALVHLFCAALFPLNRLSAGKRLTLFGLLALLFLLDLNPLIGSFLVGIPANFDVFALDAAQALSSFAALVAGLSAALLFFTLLPKTAAPAFDGARRVLARPAFVLFLCIAACAFSLWVRVGPFHGLAAVSDELSYLKQAEIFLDGHLAEPSLEPWVFFDAEQMVNDGRYYSKYPPGTSLCLLPALALKIPQAAPVFFLMLNLCLTYLLARRLFNPATGRMALFLACLSPFFVSMGESYLSHGPGLSAALGMAYFHLVWLEGGKPRHALLSGVLAGFFLLIRPVTAAMVIVPFFVHGQIKFKGGVSGRAAAAFLFLGALALFLLLMAGYNQQQTGDPFRFPYQQYASLYTPYDRFGPENAERGGVNTLFNLSRLNRWLFGFAPSLLPVLALLLMGSLAGFEILFMIALLLLAGAYVFHWFWGTPWFGPLYYYECAGFLVILSARALLLAGEALKKMTPSGNRPLYAAGLLVLLFSAPPFLAGQVDRASGRIEKVWKPLFEIQEAGALEGSWVVLPGDEGTQARYFGAAPEWMTGNIRMLNGREGTLEELKALHPGKRIFLLQKDPAREDMAGTLEEIKLE